MKLMKLIMENWRRAVYVEEKRIDYFPGGKGDELNPSDVDQKELKKGIKIELEHTKDKELAREIALDHLAEDPHYYSKLEKIEGDK